MRMVFPNHMTERFIGDLATDMNTLVTTLFGENAAQSCGESECCGENGCDTPADTPKWTRPMDVFETDTEYRIAVDLPGIDVEKIEVDVENDTVSIAATRERGENVEGETQLRGERRFGHFHRSVTLPKHVDRDAVTADYSAGILTLTLPKVAEKVTKRRVEVSAGK